MRPNRFFRIPELILCFFAFFLNFFWEVMHTYFYTLKELPFNTMLYGWLHCTVGDVMITLGSFWLVSLVSRSRRWLLSLSKMNFLCFIMIGVVYTVFSEWANVGIFTSWEYTKSMPMIPLTGIGLTPVLQWIVVPSVVIFLARDHLIISQPAQRGEVNKGDWGCPASPYGDGCLLKMDGTDRVRARYDRISPYYDLVELLLEKVVFRRWRKMLFESSAGDTILEVGVGTGKHFDFYPHGKRTTAIDFSPGMLSKARRTAIRKGVGADILNMDVQDLQFDDRSFDVVMATFVFCSVPDPITGLREIKRVCKKGGRIILLEHVRPGGKLLGEIFDVLNPIIVKLMGVNINRDTIANMERAGLHVVEERNLFRDIVKLVVANP